MKNLRNFFRGIELVIFVTAGAIIRDMVPEKWDYVVGLLVGGLIVQTTWNMIHFREKDDLKL